VPRDQQNALVAAFQKAYNSFWPYPRGALDDKSELANIIHSKSRIRLNNLITDTEGAIVIGGRSEGKRIEPTIVKDVQLDDVLMNESVQVIYLKFTSLTAGL
jgi:aldehyde dehydrogenase (NAD+)